VVGLKIGIVGVGITEFRIHEEPFYNVAYQAAKTAMKDAGIERREIDSFILGGYDSLGVGRTISNMYVAPAAGGYLRHEIRVADDAAFSIPLAFMRIKSGLSDVAIALGFGHSSETPVELVEVQSLDPLFHRDLKLAPQMGYAMQSYAYRNAYNVSEEDLAEAVVKDRKNAMKNDYAYVKEETSVEEVLNSDMAVYPLREPEIAKWCDGCVAFILAEETIARRINPDPVWIEGLGWSYDNYFLGARELDKLNSTKLAAEKAYKMAGIRSEDVDSVEIMDLTSDYHFMILEALGFADYGSGKELLDSDFPVNKSGGALCTNAYGSTGMFLMANLAMQIRNGEAERGITHAISGIGQNSVVCVLSK
jgi:acetyl-CoA C-acetyltransferase